MNLAKGFIKWLSGMFLHLSVFLVIAAFCFTLLIGNSQTVKETIAESGVYDNFTQSVINENIKNTDESKNTIPLDDENIQSIALTVFNPTFLQIETEKLIDDIYRWLEGDTNDLKFEIDFSEQREQFNSQLSQYAASRVSDLPTCENLIEGELNIFETDCKPEGYEQFIVQNQLKFDLDSSEFLKNPVIDESILPTAEDGTQLEEKFSFLPIFMYISRISIVYSLLIFILALIFYLLMRKPYQKGFKKLGRDLLSNGILIIVFTIFFGYIIPQFTSAFSIQGNETSELFNHTADVFIHKLDIIIIVVAGCFALLGVIILALNNYLVIKSPYDNLAKKAGLATTENKKNNRKSKTKSSPPIQSSESTKRQKQKKGRYKKINL